RMVAEGKIERNESLEKVLRLNRIRTLSGVAVVAILTKPFECPGLCIYCPSEKDIPKSYLANEPAVMRAVLNDFDPRRQVEVRLRALELTGHPTDKIELIVMGGTFSALDRHYQVDFIKGSFDALNECDTEDLDEALRINERVSHRCVGLTLETRPDYINDGEVIWMRRLGATRVEIGVQSIYDDVLKLIQRGHLTQETINATRLLKDAGFKVGYHIMPNLPGSDLSRDGQMFKILFENPDFRPDQLKIYPCVVVREAELYDWWREGRYKPYDEKKLISLLAEMKKSLPPYVRVSRLFRDIPSPRIEAGVKKVNLRQLVAKEMRKRGWRCRCIRCREVRDEVDFTGLGNAILFRQDYHASRGQEIFLSFEDPQREHILSFLRLRIPSHHFSGEKHIIPELEGAAIIREVHTYGELVPLGERREAAQHRGLGMKLIRTAEDIALKEFGIRKMVVISGVGVREYYRRLGYDPHGTYMIKRV
ncbi:MAG: tRNA uridine(34) 5-carboxymethylaminomethyl modification radical SAM/GNAT enzyme Elp3, partial [Actinomycetota bacterium]